jgi:hypothetical protein
MLHTFTALAPDLPLKRTIDDGICLPLARSCDFGCSLRRIVTLDTLPLLRVQVQSGTGALLRERATLNTSTNYVSAGTGTGAGGGQSSPSFSWQEGHKGWGAGGCDCPEV